MVDLKVDNSANVTAVKSVLKMVASRADLKVDEMVETRVVWWVASRVESMVTSRAASRVDLKVGEMVA